jgi:hypothetical protein
MVLQYYSILVCWSKSLNTVFTRVVEGPWWLVELDSSVPPMTFSVSCGNFFWGFFWYSLWMCITLIPKPCFTRECVAADVDFDLRRATSKTPDRIRACCNLFWCDWPGGLSAEGLWRWSPCYLATDRLRFLLVLPLIQGLLPWNLSWLWRNKQYLPVWTGTFFFSYWLLRDSYPQSGSNTVGGTSITVRGAVCLSVGQWRWLGSFDIYNIRV